MFEIRKIALACFIGAVIFGLMAFFAGSLWWLGIPAGFAGGYLAYEFREVLAAAPRAFKAFIDGSAFLGEVLLDGVGRYVRKKHPFVLFFLVMLSILIWWLPMHLAAKNPPQWQLFVVIGIVAVWGSAIATLVFCLFVVLGAAMDKVYVPQLKSFLDRTGQSELGLTYVRTIGWFLKGLYALLASFAFLFAHLFKGLWLLVKMVHSHKRLLCGIDGTLGGVMSFWLFAVNHWLMPAELSFGQKTMVVLAGGLFGAILGVANWELVSKRFLKVALPTAG